MSTTYTALTQATVKLPTHEELRDSIRALPSEPFAHWMNQHGADPATHILVLPDGYRSAIPYKLPNYVRFSDLAVSPTLINRAAAGLAGLEIPKR